MHVREYHSPPPVVPKRRRKSHFRFIVLVLLVILSFFATKRYQHAVPQWQPQVHSSTVIQQKITVPWPSFGQAAIGADGYDILASSGSDTAVPTASTAKVMTALVILKKYPLKIGESGPLITFTDNDVAIYNSYVALNGSTVQVETGEQMTEYQALQAILLPSANNIADSLATWAYGSIQAENEVANNYAHEIGMKNSHFATDASGYSPDTTSTARDLVRLGIVAMREPVISQVVGQSQADLPIVGTVSNVNGLLGQAEINGVKTGNTDQAGGVFIASARHTFDNKKTFNIIAVVMNAPSLPQAMRSAVPLLENTKSSFATTKVIHQGQVVGSYKAPWGALVDVISPQDIAIFNWAGNKLTTQTQLKGIQGYSSNKQQVGTVKVSSGTATNISAVKLEKKLPTAPWTWRVKQVFKF